MLRIRVVRGYNAMVPSHRNAHGNTFPTPLLLQQCRYVVGGDRTHNDYEYWNPYTWPMTWSSSDIKHLLSRNLLDSGNPPNYDSMSTLLGNNDISSLEWLVREYVKPPPPRVVDVASYLLEHLSSTAHCAEIPRREQEKLLALFELGLSHRIGSEKRGAALCHSRRGSGKTLLVKDFVNHKRSEAMTCGRVIVRCCDVTTRGNPQPLWLTKVLQDCKQNQQSGGSSNSTDAGLCELIRAHVESITGYPQNPSQYITPNDAYATWKRETAWWFGIPPAKENVDPLIILDTCELLAEREHKFLEHAASGIAAKTSYTLLEAFCLAIPSPHGIGFVGCNATFDDRFSLTLANVTNIGPLN
ncbi:Bodo-specific multi-copy gene family, putative [Bodo saltans]|uniref:Bodo-specific multi-copy gene family, putative n=1 Tax=Bodo saltans TaxID=75058 RepID=A0A0S4JT98_BODSA|nr:Bodo-specific multi-copy gene family, putative [Bodo saltans]|eukprot:CUG92566.1 Bodo-specific multi-copy gene family, putative [Bodo saltans]